MTKRPLHYRLDLREHVEGHLQDLIRDAERNGWNPNVYRAFAALNEAWLRAEREAYPEARLSADGYNYAKVRALPPMPGFDDDRVRTRLPWCRSRPGPAVVERGE